MNGIAEKIIPPRPAPSAWPVRLFKQLGKRIVPSIGGGLSALLGGRAGDGFGILTYHRVTPVVAWSGDRAKTRPTAPTWNVSPRRFQAQLKGLLARGYRPLPLRKILDLCKKGQPVPAGTFAVTFDDGYENVYVHAWPVLRDLNTPATIFVAAAYLDSGAPFPFDDWPSAGSDHVRAETWKPLTTAQCAEMYASGLIDLGSHTHTHGVFPGRPEAFRQDLAASVAALRSRFGIADATLAFPFGIADNAMAAEARRGGLLCGLTTQGDLVQPGSDPFTWGRFSVEETDTAASLAAKLDGWYSLARDAWLRWRGKRTGAATSLWHGLQTVPQRMLPDSERGGVVARSGDRATTHGQGVVNGESA